MPTKELLQFPSCPGRFIDTLQYFGRLQQEGQIERFDVSVLGPTGGNLSGIWLLRGTAGQIDSLRRSEEWVQLMQRVPLSVNGLRVADAFVDEGLAEVMGNHQTLIDELN